MYTLQTYTSDAAENIISGPCMFQGIVINSNAACIVQVHDATMAGNPIFTLQQAAAGTMTLLLPYPVRFEKGCTISVTAGDIQYTVLLA